jgi:opacity protein-like surface antigen
MVENLRKAVVVIALVLGFGASIACAQTTLAGSVYGAFQPSSSGNQTTQHPSNSAGALLELRHIWNPLLGLEISYSYHRADEDYTKLLLVPGPTDTVAASIPTNAHEIAADWVGSFRLANLRPFVLVGGGWLLDVPAAGNVTATTTLCSTVGAAACTTSTGSIPTRTQTEDVFQYGAGVDWMVLPHIGLRFQYRGNVYKAASLSEEFTSTDKFTQDAEPVAGVFFQF